MPTQFRYLALGALLAAGCSSGTTAPREVVPGPIVNAITPASLSTTGGATVTISGANLGVTSSITLDGVAITGATISGSSIAFAAPAHAAGTAQFVVTNNGKSAFASVTFVAPTGANAAPVINGITVTGPASKPPSPFVDLSSSVTLSAAVSDSETPPSSMTFAWTVPAGAISGTGANVTWQLPASLATTPSAVSVSLTVTEAFSENGVQHRNVSTASFAADAHDSSTEILDQAYRFLDLFSQSSVPPATVMTDFYGGCEGAANELADTEKNRRVYRYRSYTLTRLPPVTFNYGQLCATPKGAFRADACAVIEAHWVADVIMDYPPEEVRAGDVVFTDGRDYLTSVFRGGRWWLCDSTWQGESVVQSPSGSLRHLATPASLAPGRIKSQ